MTFIFDDVLVRRLLSLNLLDHGMLLWLSAWWLGISMFSELARFLGRFACLLGVGPGGCKPAAFCSEVSAPLRGAREPAAIVDVCRLGGMTELCMHIPEL